MLDSYYASDSIGNELLRTIDGKTMQKIQNLLSGQNLAFEVCRGGKRAKGFCSLIDKHLTNTLSGTVRSWDTKYGGVI